MGVRGSAAKAGCLGGCKSVLNEEVNRCQKGEPLFSRKLRECNVHIFLSMVLGVEESLKNDG